MQQLQEQRWAAASETPVCSSVPKHSSFCLTSRHCYCLLQGSSGASSSSAGSAGEFHVV